MAQGITLVRLALVVGLVGSISLIVARDSPAERSRSARSVIGSAFEPATSRHAVRAAALLFTGTLRCDQCQLAAEYLLESWPS